VEQTRPLRRSSFNHPRDLIDYAPLEEIYVGLRHSPNGLAG
jgi:hypothetical protein